VVAEGYKYPPTTTTPSIQVSNTSHSIQELVHSLLDTIQKNQSLSKSQIHSKHIVTSEREMCPWAISISILVIRCPTHIE
jgi:DNA-directed RNA polymerase beta' subunit